MADVRSPSTLGGQRRSGGGRPRDDRLDARIIDATIAEVGARGWAAATVDGIAVRAGVGKASIYRRWRTKDELFAFAASRIASPAPDVDTGDVAADLLGVLGPMAEPFSHPNLAVLLPALFAEASQDEEIRASVRDFAEQRRRPAIRAVERARARGELPEDTDAEGLVDMVAGGIVYRFLLLGEAVDGRTVERLVRQALRGAVPADRSTTETTR